MQGFGFSSYRHLHVFALGIPASSNYAIGFSCCVTLIDEYSISEHRKKKSKRKTDAKQWAMGSA